MPLMEIVDRFQDDARYLHCSYYGNFVKNITSYALVSFMTLLNTFTQFKLDNKGIRHKMKGID